MRVYRITKSQYVTDFSGRGAATFGGRWNSKGTYILYTAASLSLAMLETVVHLSETAATSMYLAACLELPLNNVEIWTPEDLPERWRDYPSLEVLKNIGDDFVRRNDALALKLPSVIIPEESNYLVNPRHQQFNEIKLVYSRDLSFDTRLLKPAK